jgi:hypothetical protein
MTRAYAIVLAGLPLLVAAAPAGRDPQAAAFLGESHAAMDRMMAGMAAPSTGQVDRDFVAMMEPHHQSAIDMAVAELRYGKDPQLKRIAQEIIVDQQQEIAAMRLAIGQPLPAAAPVPTDGAVQSAPASAHHMHDMEH